MKYIVFTQQHVEAGNLYPFTLTRRVQDIRAGIFTIREKWQKFTGLSTFDMEGEDHFPSELNPTISLKKIDNSDIAIIVQANLIPNRKILLAAKKLKPGEAIASAEGKILIQAVNVEQVNRNGTYKPAVIKEVLNNVILLQFPWHIFQYNQPAMIEDYTLLTLRRKSSAIHKSNGITNAKNIFIEKGAVVKHAIVNADAGPVYIAKNALVMEGVCLRGPVYVGEGAVIKMGARIYGATTIGPNCVAGGEIKNSILFANSNKAHDGYLGDSVIGEWCNLGAGTTNSNLKNTAGNIHIPLYGKDYTAGIKCGVLMGDFTRTAINTTINTGTVIGVSCNVFGNGFTPHHIPSFSWGMNNEAKYKLDKALTDAGNWKKLKHSQLSETEKKILTNIYKQTK